MLLKRINIEHKLCKQQLKHHTTEFDILDSVKVFLKDDAHKDQRILNEISKESHTLLNPFDFDKLDSSKIFHIKAIKQICIDYRLRFLDSHYYKGHLPYEAISKIKTLEKQHNTRLEGFKIMAPSKLFKLENADDPLLFVPMGNDYFYLIHKWGNDLNPFRKLLMLPFKNFENLAFTTLMVSFLATILVPDGLFSDGMSTSEFWMIFFFMFKSIAAIVIYYGFAAGKNFNTAIWNSKYYNM